MAETQQFPCECDEECTATIPPGTYQSLDDWRAEHENESGDPVRDGETRLLAGFDHYIVTAEHAQGHPVVQRYGAYCVIARDLT